VSPDLDDAVRALKAERDENDRRLPMSQAEKVDLATRLLALERPKAQERQQSGALQTHAKLGRSATEDASGNLPEASKGTTRDKVAEAVGLSPRTVQKIKDIAEAAGKPAGQARYGDLADRTKSEAIDPIFQEFKKREEVYAAADQQPGVFGVFAERLKAEDTATVHRDYGRKVKQGTTKGEELLDATGFPVPAHLKDLFGDRWLVEAAQAVEEFARDTWKRIMSKVERKGQAYGSYFLLPEMMKTGALIKAELERYHALLTAGRPHAVHQRCEGKGCEDCRRYGWLTRWRWTELKLEGKL
jgi:hypothetical protein